MPTMFLRQKYCFWPACLHESVLIPDLISLSRTNLLQDLSTRYSPPASSFLHDLVIKEETLTLSKTPRILSLLPPAPPPATQQNKKNLKTMAPPQEFAKFCYTVPNTDHTLDTNIRLRALDDNDNNPRSNPTHTLGALSILPLELLDMVLAQLDLRSLTTLRLVNKRSREAVDAGTRYQQVITHARVVLQAALFIGTANFTTCQDLYTELCTGECRTCGDFGGYIYLLTCRRVCFRCFTNEIEYLPLSPSEVKRLFGVGARDIENFSIPLLRSVAGFYSCRGQKWNRSLVLVDRVSARTAGIALRGGVEAMEQHVQNQARNAQQLYVSRVAAGGIPRAPRTLETVDEGEANPRRFMGVVRAPALGVGGLDWGVRCLGCKNEYRPKPSGLHWLRLFTWEGLEEHIREYGEVKEEKVLDYVIGYKHCSVEGS